jgi:hypothetical protein
MAFGNLGRTIAGQAIETTKKQMLDSLLTPETPKAPEKPPAPPSPEPAGTVILNQVQAMQRALREDQELAVLFHTGSETLRVLEIFVPSTKVFVLAGVDAEQNVTRAVVPADTAQLVCKVLKVAEGAKAVRVNVLAPRQ